MLGRGPSEQYSSLRCRGEKTCVVDAANRLLHHVRRLGSDIAGWLGPRR